MLDKSTIASCFKVVLTPHPIDEVIDTVQFLASEVFENLNSCIISPSNLQGVIGGHLLDLQLCSSETECELICEDIHNMLLYPGKLEETDKEIDEYDVLEPGQCEMCERHPMPLTFHHLIPRKVHKKFSKRFGLSKEELNVGALLCRQCHSTVHRRFDHETLALEYNSVEKLLQDDKIRSWALYASKQKANSIKFGGRKR